MVSEALKEQVRDFWNQDPCGSMHGGGAEPFTRAYYDAMEAHRYFMEPEIFAFAQFARHHGQKVLEVGVGAGTDFVQWVRAGAEAYGIDLTPEGIRHVQARLALYDLQAADVRVADAEALPYPDDFFDVVYSWGVIHHSPDTAKALAEIVRVLRPGGVGKIMVYHLDSVQAFLMWVRYALLTGRPWRSRRDVIWHHQESIGTKAYTYGEVRQMLAAHPVENIHLLSPVNKWDLFADMGKPRWKQFIQRGIATLMGRERAGWWLRVTFAKKATFQV